ncbi:RNA polymerase sigma factor, sigma-70 family [Saprospira grandis DSM 2844]|uniref:RNA polymerase sigma factor, sigma-70 family n=1 Tax=Saprospira grandis DSM 2844 TaxID=694433 RepID=J1I488_9BACT|nr:RNA polymerase sigma factor RpoD/SigA [Saprospira grandis]EJF53565.1 RNA polymerase sigma factor, sigma-70 family [Saprospira grandis DSM 2844]
MRQLKITQKITQRESSALENYLKDVSKISMVSAEEEVVLAKKVRAGDQQALHRLTTANLRFVISVAKQYQHQGMALSDLINEGNLGLIKAAHRFDESKGFKFISYAVWWIRQSILQSLMEHGRMVRLPSNKLGGHGRLLRARQRFMQEHEREPSVAELAEILELREKDIVALERMIQKHISVDAPLGAGERDSDVNMLDTLACSLTEEGDQALMEESSRIELKGQLDRLSDLERQIIVSYYGLYNHCPMTLESIGEDCGLTRERVRQIKQRALRRLRRYIKADLVLPSAS